MFISELVSSLASVWIFYSLSLICIPASADLEDDFIYVDGIRVREADLLQTQFEQKKVEEAMEQKDKIDQEEALLYNESKEWTKNLPNKCQVCRLVVTEIQRKLKIFGKEREITEQGRPLYYKDDMVIWHVFDEICDEMTQYNIDKRTPFRYRKGAKSYLRRKADDMTKHIQQTQWIWNIDAADIDDPTGEIRRLTKQCNEMVIKHQDDIRRWFYTSQNADPLKWLCAQKILKPRDAHGCLWIKDKYLDQLVQFGQHEKGTSAESERESKSSRVEL